MNCIISFSKNWIVMPGFPLFPSNITSDVKPPTLELIYSRELKGYETILAQDKQIRCQAKLFSRTVYSDFQAIKGIPYAFKTQAYVKDKIVMEESVKKIEVNPGVDINLFKIEGNK
jgi:hypothetical protein